MKKIFTTKVLAKLLELEEETYMLPAISV